VAEQLVVRAEEAVDGLDGVDYIESTSREGSGSINVRTKLGVDYEKLLDEVKARVDGIRNLPPDSFRPQVFRWDARPDIMYLALYGQKDRLTQSLKLSLEHLSTNLRVPLKHLAVIYSCVHEILLTTKLTLKKLSFAKPRRAALFAWVILPK